MLDQGCGRDANPSWGSETILDWHSSEQVKRETRDDNKEVCFVDEMSNSAGHKQFDCDCENKPEVT